MARWGGALIQGKCPQPTYLPPLPASLARYLPGSNPAGGTSQSYPATRGGESSAVREEKEGVFARRGVRRGPESESAGEREGEERGEGFGGEEWE